MTKLKLNSSDRFSPEKFRLLELPEIMDLKIVDDFSYTIKVLAISWNTITKFVSDEFNDKDLGSDVLSISEHVLAMDQKRQAEQFRLSENRERHLRRSQKPSRAKPNPSDSPTGDLTPNRLQKGRQRSPR